MLSSFLRALWLMAGIVLAPVSAFADAACPVDPAAPDALLALTRAPYENVDDTYLRMRCLEDALALRGDRRVVFASNYARTTQEILAYLEDEAFFDTPWAARYTVIFADQYRRAFYAWERGDFLRVPAPWRIAFATSATGEALIVQELFLSVNAHVNYDLANTLYELGLSGATREERLMDHRLVNEILGSIVGEQMRLLQEMYAPGLASLPEPAEDFAEDFFYFNLENGRRHAWNRGTALVDARSGFARAFIRGLNSTEAQGVASLILAPKLSPELMRALKRLEQGH